MEELNVSNEVYLVCKLCMGGQPWWRAAAGQEHVEHFSSLFVIREKGPALGRTIAFEH